MLRHLESVGFDGAPRVVGLDEQGREVLTFLPGEVALRPWPDCLLADSGMVALGSFLRRYHQAVERYTPPPDTRWRVPGVNWRSNQIIRHGELGPWNTVWKDGILVGVIDWDFAEPGYPIEDIAQLAWYAVPLRNRKKCEEAGVEFGSEQTSRLRLLCETYGVSVREVLETLSTIQSRELERIVTLGKAGLVPWYTFLERGDGKRVKEDSDWLKGNQENLQAQADLH